MPSGYRRPAVGGTSTDCQSRCIAQYSELMFSKPRAWFWTLFLSLGCGVAGYLGALSLGLAFGWAVTVGCGVVILTGTHYGTYALGHGTDALPDNDGEQRDSSSQ